VIVRELDKKKILKYQGYLTQIEPAALLSTVHEFALSEDRRGDICQLGRQMVDGKGTKRVLEAIMAS
jgi:spore coat polysaccharide biosynthesis predicted glycosyltransferase SpsG